MSQEIYMGVCNVKVRKPNCFGIPHSNYNSLDFKIFQLKFIYFKI